MRVQKMNDVSAIRDEVEIPGIGVLNINAFVLHAEQPVLVDTGRPIEREAFIDAVGSVIEPKDIKWIWITHPDRDHMGALFDLLEMAPDARLVSTFAAVGYMTVEWGEAPLPRAYLLNPGQSLDVGDRKLTAFRPPLFDSPFTVGFYDESTGTCFSSDCFGAPMPTMDAALVDDARDVPADVVRAGQLTWGTLDSPWVLTADVAKWAPTYDHIRARRPERVLSTHLPPATGQTDAFLGFLGEVPNAEPWVGPDQAQLEAMMAGVPEQVGAPEPVGT